MNEELLWRVLKIILMHQHMFFALGAEKQFNHAKNANAALIEAIDRELESYEEAKHG